MNSFKRRKSIISILFLIPCLILSGSSNGSMSRDQISSFKYNAGIGSGKRLINISSNESVVEFFGVIDEWHRLDQKTKLNACERFKREMAIYMKRLSPELVDENLQDFAVLSEFYSRLVDEPINYISLDVGRSTFVDCKEKKKQALVGDLVMIEDLYQHGEKSTAINYLLNCLNKYPESRKEIEALLIQLVAK